MIGPIGLKFSEFNQCHHGVVIRKYGEDQSETLPMGLFSPKIFWLCSHPYA